MRPESIAAQLLAFKRKTKRTPVEYLAEARSGAIKDTQANRRLVWQAQALTRVRYVNYDEAETVDTANMETIR